MKNFLARRLRGIPPWNPQDRRKRKLQARRRVLEETARSLGGVLASTKDFADPRDHVERMIESESAPVITHREWLERHGLHFLAPSFVAEDKRSAELKRLVDALAFARVFFLGTNHLDDQAFHERLWKEVLEAEEPDIPRDENDAFMWDFSLWGENDTAVWLAFHASNEEREAWAEEFLGEPLPPRLTCPSDRDDDLPQPHGAT